MNDSDGLLCNFFRALQYAPDEVAAHADHPVNELDLHAWHRALVSSRNSITEQLINDPKFYDAELAGQWVWGISQWIGTGWCPPAGAASAKTPHLGNAGLGLHCRSIARGRTKDGGLWKARPSLGNGVNSQGNGVHQTGLSRQMPHLGSSEHGTTHQGINGLSYAPAGALYEYFRALSARLRQVRVVCGDFARILGPSVTWRHGITAVFLDPPYADGEHTITYAGGGNVWERVTHWCEENGDHPQLRIALCGYEGTWTAPADWQAVKWRTPGGYGSQGNGHGRENAKREIVWFNRSCVGAEQHSFLDQL